MNEQKDIKRKRMRLKKEIEEFFFYSKGKLLFKKTGFKKKGDQENKRSNRKGNEKGGECET